MAKAVAKKKPSSAATGQDLIIVESPTKAKTIQKYLKGKYAVMATVGHVKDLPKSKLGVDVENNFEPHYVMIDGKNKVMTEIKTAARKAAQVYLAPDPDREGEAIAQHVADILHKDREGAAHARVHRVLFHEITKKAIDEALQKPMDLNVHLFEAHKARRVLDRLVGYEISPVLWDKVRRGLSAGRVQSVAVRMICDREREIAAFVPEEYWNLLAHLKNAKGETLTARLFRIGDEKAELKNEAQVQGILAELDRVDFIVQKIEKKEQKRNPVPPFITSKLQQDAANRLGFTAKKTMVLAQQLYEGVDLGELGTTGLITYMRTDSVRVSTESVEQARAFVASQFGKEHLPDTPNFYKSKKGAQDAHEAIRPTSMELPPVRVADFLDRDQLRLYELIWNRFVASQMKPAIFDRTTVDIAAGKYTFRANGSVLKYAGFLQVYEESITTKEKGESEDGILPMLAEKEKLHLQQLVPSQHFTQPPPRYTESSLVKALEENGIGRPSTYASIMETILLKDYVRKEENKFVPTKLGMLVTELLVGSFPDILNVEFTAKMEDELDRVEEGDKNWVEILRDFYRRFRVDLERAKEEMRNLKAQAIETDIVCEHCKSKMVIKWGRNGEFLACSAYPNCRSTKEFTRNDKGEIEIVKNEVTGEVCEKCGKAMVIKRGRFGVFVACSGYPECRNTKALTTGVKCPEKDCHGDLAIRYSRKGKVFYSCNRYPACKYAIWDKPIPEACPTCEAPFLVEKFTKKTGTFVKCMKCDYKRSMAE